MYQRGTRIKMANIKLHEIEAQLYEKIHLDIFNRFEQSLIMQRLLKAVGSDRHMCLDVGCGTGNMTEKEALIFDRVIGVDICPKMLHVAKRRLKQYVNIDLIVCDAEHLPFRDKIFNFISLFSVLHHIPNLSRTLKELYRIMAPGGVLLIEHEPNTWIRRLFISRIQFPLSLLATLIRYIRTPSLMKIQGSLDYETADIHAKYGFKREYVSRILQSIGFTDIQIKTHFLFSPFLSLLPKPFNKLAWLDSYFDALPLLAGFGHTINIKAMKSSSIECNNEIVAHKRDVL